MAKMYTLESTTIFSFFSRSAGKKKNKQAKSWCGCLYRSRTSIAVKKLKPHRLFSSGIHPEAKEWLQRILEREEKDVCDLLDERKGLFLMWWGTLLTSVTCGRTKENKIIQQVFIIQTNGFLKYSWHFRTLILNLSFFDVLSQIRQTCSYNFTKLLNATCS